jgi:hypothetical protein
MGKFAADVSQLVKKTEDRLRYVALQSIQDVMEAAQQPQLGITKGATSFVEGKIPVAEGELRGSLKAELLGGASALGPDSYAVVLSGYEVGDTMRFTWTARHALPMELGFTARNGRQVPGRFFVTRNAERFSSFVAARVAEANAR